MDCRIAICDDSPVDASYVAGLVRSWAQQNEISARIDMFASAEELLFQFTESGGWEMLLLDIEMPGMDGVSLARQIRRADEGAQIIFITGHMDYIADGYDVAALHYLMKPLAADKLSSVLGRAWEKLRRNERMLTIDVPGELTRVPLYEIRYLEVAQNYVSVHAHRTYTVKRALREFERELDDRFVRASRSCMVNLAYIRRVTRTEVHLSDGTVLPLSRGMFEKINRAIIERM